MRRTNLTVPELVLLVGTRVAAGVGVGLLISEKLDHSARRAAGVALVAVGVLTTIPLMVEVFGSRVEGDVERASA
jgi:hypothetical protein